MNVFASMLFSGKITMYKMPYVSYMPNLSSVRCGCEHRARDMARALANRGMGAALPYNPNDRDARNHATFLTAGLRKGCVYLAHAVIGSVLLIGSAQAAGIVTLSAMSQSSQTQSQVPITFGQIFKDGDVPSGDTLNATISGQTIPLQVDTKATNPDGSLRHAVLTAVMPSLPADSTEPITLSVASSSSVSGGSVTLSQLLATTFDATVNINISGIDYTADARQLLQSVAATNACAPWDTSCNVWLSGPLVSEWIVGEPVTSAGGVSNPNLQIYFDVRAYAGNPINHVRVNVVIENDWAYTPQTSVTYNATLTSGSDSYTINNLTQYAYARWHHVLWWGVRPSVYVQADTQYLQASGAVSRYEILQPDNSFLNGVIQSCAPMQHCDQTQTMANTGAQSSIGPLPQWTSTYVVDPDYRAYRWMLADDDAAGAYSFHYRDQTTGFPLSIVNHPYVTIANWTYANSAASQNPNTWGKDLLPQCSGCGTGNYSVSNPNVFDIAHHPSIADVSYIVTGSYYYLEELQYTASFIELWQNPGYRGYSTGTLWTGIPQTRGKAWSLRSIGDAAYITPDADPLKIYFNTMIDNAVDDLNARFTDNPGANPFGIIESEFGYTVNGIAHSGIATWQNSFATWAAGHLADLGIPGASALRDWMSKFNIGLMTDWENSQTHGYCWLLGSAYDLQVKTASGAFLPSFTSLYQMNFPSLYGLDCDSPAMVSALSTLEGGTLQEGEMVGYPSSPTGFPANFQIGLAAAADSNEPNAHQAWQIFQARSVQPNYSDDPNFAVLPRYLPAVPIVNLYANPNPVVASGDQTTLYWNASNATSCSAAWASSGATSGQATVGPIMATTSYPLTCTGPNGATKAVVTASIGTPPSHRKRPTILPGACTRGGFRLTGERWR